MSKGTGTDASNTTIMREHSYSTQGKLTAHFNTATSQMSYTHKVAPGSKATQHHAATYMPAPIIKTTQQQTYTTGREPLDLPMTETGKITLQQLCAMAKGSAASSTASASEAEVSNSTSAIHKQFYIPGMVKQVIFKNGKILVRAIPGKICGGSRAGNLLKFWGGGEVAMYFDLGFRGFRGILI